MVDNVIQYSDLPNHFTHCSFCGEPKETKAISLQMSASQNRAIFGVCQECSFAIRNFLSIAWLDQRSNTLADYYPYYSVAFINDKWTAVVSRDGSDWKTFSMSGMAIMPTDDKEQLVNQLKAFGANYVE